MIEVREARPDEWATAGAVTAAAYQEFFVSGALAHRWDRPEDYLSRLADVARRAQQTLVLVALLDGEIVGSATVELDGRIEPDSPPPAPGTAHLRMVGVSPTARRQGVARALIAASIDAARAAGRDVLTLHTTAAMAGAQRLYEGLGFVRGADSPLGDDLVLLSFSLSLTG